MNYCSDRHEPVYKITYRPNSACGSSPEWKVCDWCYEKRAFGNLEEIKSITKLDC